MNGEISGEAPRLIEARQARNSFSVFYRGRFLLSQVDPQRQAERAALAAMPLAARTLYFLPSPLLGYGIPLIIQALPPDSALLCVEADAALARLYHEHTPQDQTDQRFQFIQTANPGAVPAFVNKVWGHRRFRRVVPIHLTGGWQLNAGFYTTAADLLRSSLATDWYNALTLSKLGRLYIKNAMRNLPLLALARSLESVDFGGRPALVFGAGPSLDSFFDRLGRDHLPESCVKICVDTALKPLFERNIKPDMVVALDAQHWNLRDFCGTGGWRIPVAMALSAPPALSGVLGGDCRMFWTRWTELAIFDRLTALGLMPLELPPLGSVGLSAVSLALRLGAGLVFTVGIDLAFTMDKYHCRNSPSHGELLRRHNRLGGLYPLAAFRAASQAVPAGASHNSPVWLDDPVMRRCRSLFADEFTKEGSVFAVGENALTGIKTISVHEALEKIKNSAAHHPPACLAADAACGIDPVKADMIAEFIKNEDATLTELLGILKGEISAPAGRLDSLLDAASYLWAHFPDCAGMGGSRPPSTDIVFLKRVRAEASRPPRPPRQRPPAPASGFKGAPR